MTRKTFLTWRSQSSPKGALRPLLAAAINCSSLHARRSLTAAASLCAEKNVLITTLNLLFRPELSIAGSLNLFTFHPLADILRTVLQLHPTRLAISSKLHCIAICQPHIAPRRPRTRHLF